MLRDYRVSGKDWSLKTMTVMRDDQMEQIREYLERLPERGLFSGCTQEDVQELWDLSYYAREQKTGFLVSDYWLKKRVLVNLPRELRLISPRECELLDDMMNAHGTAELMDWDDMGGAMSLVSRLWCTLTVRGERYFLHLSKSLADRMRPLMNSEKYRQERLSLYQFDIMFHGLLYEMGRCPADYAARRFVTEVACENSEWAEMMAYRYLRGAFEYALDDDGQMVLVHPAVADASALAKELPEHVLEAFSADMLLSGVNGILPEEEILHMDMMSAISGGIRPDVEAEDAAEDLRLLVKQGISYDELKKVLSSLLLVMPTASMEAALMALYERTPRWPGVTGGVRN